MRWTSGSTSARASRPSFSTVISAFLPLALTRQSTDEPAVLEHRAGARNRAKETLSQFDVRR